MGFGRRHFQSSGGSQAAVGPLAVAATFNRNPKHSKTFLTTSIKYTQKQSYKPLITPPFRMRGSCIESIPHHSRANMLAPLSNLVCLLSGITVPRQLIRSRSSLPAGASGGVRIYMRSHLIMRCRINGAQVRKPLSKKKVLPHSKGNR